MNGINLNTIQISNRGCDDYREYDQVNQKRIIIKRMGKERGEEKDQKKSKNTCSSCLTCILDVVCIIVLIRGIILWRVENTRVDRINE